MTKEYNDDVDTLYKLIQCLCKKHGCTFTKFVSDILKREAERIEEEK